MRKVLWLVCIWLVGTCAVQAQSQHRLPKAALPPFALTPRDGEAILAAASDRAETNEDQPDCSHLTFDVYSRAGYPYPYASSIDLYSGIKGFVRVRRPQPGDLIVWRGHVGIVVDTALHSFYSSLRSGLKTDFYDSPAWTARGTARFYRYAVPTSTANLLSQVDVRAANRRTTAPFLTSPTLADFSPNSFEAGQPVSKRLDSSRARSQPNGQSAE
jgi:hypothetical protein